MFNFTIMNHKKVNSRIHNQIDLLKRKNQLYLHI